MPCFFSRHVNYKRRYGSSSNWAGATIYHSNVYVKTSSNSSDEQNDHYTNGIDKTILSTNNSNTSASSTSAFVTHHNRGNNAPINPNDDDNTNRDGGEWGYFVDFRSPEQSDLHRKSFYEERIDTNM